MVTEAMLMTGEAVATWAIQEGIPIPFTTQAPPWMDERPRDLAGMVALRRASQPSQPSSVPGPHAGLGLSVYAQVTSPLRRYPDLVVHQQVRAHLCGGALLDAAQVLDRVGETAATSASVRLAERLSRRHWTLVYLMDGGWRGEAILWQRREGATVLMRAGPGCSGASAPDLPLNSVVLLALRSMDWQR
jgi:exoribonuclease-2